MGQRKSRVSTGGSALISLALAAVWPDPSLAAPGAAAPGAAAPTVGFVAEAATPDLVLVEVSGLPAAPLRQLAGLHLDPVSWAAVLAVTAVDPSDPLDDPPQLLGRWSVVTGGLRFAPRYPPSPGLELRVFFDGSAFDQLLGPSTTPATSDATGHYRVPELERRPSTRVETIHPAAEVLPANLLRLYVWFSAPMSARQVVQHIRLLDDHGQIIATAFVEIPDGLWDPDRRRLTLLVHPGRVKRGVGPNLALGPVLVPGHSYQLVIDHQARDADGLPLGEDFVHTFRAGQPDHRSPDPTGWRLTLPSGPLDPVVAQLSEPADQALLERLLSIETADGQPLEGRSTVGPDATSWRFVPDRPWVAGSYVLVVPDTLEDPSGNRVGRRFEEPEAAPLAAPGEPGGSDQAVVRRAFTISFP